MSVSEVWPPTIAQLPFSPCSQPKSSCLSIKFYNCVHEFLKYFFIWMEEEKWLNGKL